ncbi:hypothetical protein AGMMS50268_01690 [Spirochaetia bacterium]|nr:hypothetical protein AGMMS50268_01690 [Spirochaetia bacterium]
MAERDMQKELSDLGIISLDGIGELTRKSVFAVIDAVKEDNAKTTTQAEWDHINALEKAKASRIQGDPL